VLDLATHRSAVSILGGAETGIALQDPRSIAEMVLIAVEGALDDAALSWDDIDAVVTASVDLFDGLTASSIAVTEVVGAVMKPETRIAADGLAAAIHAVHQIESGAYNTVLVVAHGKASMAPHWDLTSWRISSPVLTPPWSAAGRRRSSGDERPPGAESPGQPLSKRCWSHRLLQHPSGSKCPPPSVTVRVPSS